MSPLHMHKSGDGTFAQSGDEAYLCLKYGTTCMMSKCSVALSCRVVVKLFKWWCDDDSDGLWRVMWWIVMCFIMIDAIYLWRDAYDEIILSFYDMNELMILCCYH